MAVPVERKEMLADAGIEGGIPVVPFDEGSLLRVRCAATENWTYGDGSAWNPTAFKATVRREI
jgi:hypothetical protein